MRVATILVFSAALVCGCEHWATQTPVPPPSGPFMMPGVYVLQSINGERVPAQASGTDVVLADTVYLTDGYTFKHVELFVTGGDTVLFRSAGWITGGMAADSTMHVSFLQSDPAYATFQMAISKQGQGTLIVWPFVFRYQR